MQKVKFKHWNCLVQKAEYENGRLALILIGDNNRQETITVATVNLPNKPIADGYVFVKDYSENEGILDALVAGNVVRDTGITVPMGSPWVKATLCEYIGG